MKKKEGDSWLKGDYFWKIFILSKFENCFSLYESLSGAILSESRGIEKSLLIYYVPFDYLQCNYITVR